MKRIRLRYPSKRDYKRWGQVLDQSRGDIFEIVATDIFRRSVMYGFVFYFYRVPSGYAWPVCQAGFHNFHANNGCSFIPFQILSRDHPAKSAHFFPEPSELS